MLYAQNSIDWKGAEWIALEPADTVMEIGLHFPDANQVFKNRTVGNYKLPLFRSVRKVDSKINKAVAYICGLGHFEMFINGIKVGGNFLEPGWTDYSKEAEYVIYNVKDYLNLGANQLDVMVGNGFFNIPNERYYKLITSYGQPRLKMAIHVEYDDGKIDTWITDTKSWNVCEGPITYSSIFGGEDYDATRMDSLLWKQPVKENSDIKLIPQEGTAVTIRKTIPVKNYFKNSQGAWIYDLGQNFAGIVRLKVKGERGRKVKLTPSELLKGDKVNQTVAAPYYWEYTLRGSSYRAEQWQPQFTYYGFRYVEVRGAVPQGEENPEHLPIIENLEGLLTCSASTEVGSFECSDTLFNQIHDLIDWAILSNMQSVITDCPHREKLGWVEQCYLMQHSILYRYNAHKLYKKNHRDMAVAQRPNGCIPTIAPYFVEFVGGFEDTPEWGSAFIVSAWQIYKWYGDLSLIDDYYPSMKRYIEYLSSRAVNGIIAYGLGDWYDIGPNHPGVSQLTTNGVTATAIYYYDLVLMKKMAEKLGLADDARKFSKTAMFVKEKYNEKYYNKRNGFYDRNSQTANAMSLYVGLVPEKERAKVLQSLIDDIKNRDYSLTAGDIGYRFVLQVLQEADRSDIIYKMNRRNDVPGYGWQLAHNATALTESWQALEGVSNNHLMLGHLMEWLYGGLGGIYQSDESVGWKHIVIAPQFIEGMEWVKTSFRSPQGMIECHWKRLTDGILHLKAVIPDNTEAEVILPNNETHKVGGGTWEWTVAEVCKNR